MAETLPTSGAPLVFRRLPSVDTGARLPADGPRRYFRCSRLSATLSLFQCRMNRVKLSYHDALAQGMDPLPLNIQPLACWSCAQAQAVESGSLPFYTAEEVLAGWARDSDAASFWTDGSSRHRAFSAGLPDTVASGTADVSGPQCGLFSL